MTPLRTLGRAIDRHKNKPRAVHAPRASTGCCLSLGSYDPGGFDVASIDKRIDLSWVNPGPSPPACGIFSGAAQAPMETRDVLLKADKVSVVFERIADGKIRVTTTSWDDAKVILPNQVLEVATIGKQVGLVRVDKPIAYLDIDDTGLVEAGYGPQA
jgi:hypothetical protein